MKVSSVVSNEIQLPSVDAHSTSRVILHLSANWMEPEGDGEAVRDHFDGFANPLRLAAYSAASHLLRPAGRWRMLEILHLSEAKGEVDRQLVADPEGDGEAVLDVVDRSETTEVLVKQLSE